MKKLMILLVVAVLSILVGGSVPAHAEDMDQCSHEPTIQALRECVQHAVMEGHIDDATIAQSLFAKLDAAQAALDRGQPAVAVQILQAFVYQVQAQAGVHIDHHHAEHMIMHAQAVIAALQ
jgi:hypothetical protein